MQKIQHYVLFPNHDNGMRLYGILKEAGIKATIAPEMHRRESDRNIKNCRH